MHFEELRDFLLTITDIPEKQREAGNRVINELVTRINLLLGIGLDYLNLNRRSATLSGGESQAYPPLYTDRIWVDGYALCA